MTDTPRLRPPPYVGNVIWPRPGRCFRMVYGDGRNDYPAPCPEPVIRRGVILDPKGRRVTVEACEVHAADVAESL